MHGLQDHLYGVWTARTEEDCPAMEQATNELAGRRLAATHDIPIAVRVKNGAEHSACSA